MKRKFSIYSLALFYMGFGILFVLNFNSFIYGQDPNGTVTDIDGNVYKTIKIGNQWWMAENLKVTHYRNGDPIPNVTDGNEWSNLTSGAYYDYDNDPSNVGTYGRLYNWYVVNDSRNIAPEGWHVPSDEEWKQLEMGLGMSRTVADATGWRGSNEGGKLKEEGTTHWKIPNTGATNESGFTALPGGYRDNNGNNFNLSENANFWSSTGYNSSGAWDRRLLYDRSVVNRSSLSKRYGFSVRCVKGISNTTQIYFEDNFEYTNSVTNHGWTFTPVGDDASVYTSTSRAYSGNRSLFMDSQDDDEQRIKHVFSAPLTDVVVEVYMYDDLQPYGWNHLAVIGGSVGATMGFSSEFDFATHYSTEAGSLGS